MSTSIKRERPGDQRKLPQIAVLLESAPEPESGPGEAPSEEAEVVEVSDSGAELEPDNLGAAVKRLRALHGLPRHVVRVEHSMNRLLAELDREEVGPYFRDMTRRLQEHTQQVRETLQRLGPLEQFLAQHGRELSEAPLGYFSVLPADVLELILWRLDVADLGRLAQVCQGFQRLVNADVHWRHQFEARWPEYAHMTLDDRRLACMAYPLVSEGQMLSWRGLMRYRTKLKSHWAQGKFTRTVDFLDHTNQVCCCQFDDRKVVSGSFDESIRVWDVEKGTCLRTLSRASQLDAHTDRVLCLQYSGERLVSGGRDEMIKVWDLNTFDVVSTLTGHSDNVWHLKFQDNIVVSASADRTVRVWDLRSGSEVHVLRGHSRGLSCIAFQNNLIASGSADKSIRIWDMRTMSCLKALDGHEHSIYSLHYADNRLVSGSEDCTCRVWDLDSMTCKATLKGHSSAVYYVTFDHDRIASGSSDFTVRTWSWDTVQAAVDSQPKAALCGHPADVETPEMILGNEAQRCCLSIYRSFHLNTIRCIQLDTYRMLTASADRKLKMWYFM